MSFEVAKPLGDALHESSAFLTAPTTEIADREEARLFTMSDVVYELWFRELAATLFSSFLHVKQVDILIRSLDPRRTHGHFLKWLKDVVDQEQKLFIFPAQPGAPNPPDPGTPLSLAPPPTDAISKLQIRDLTNLYDPRPDRSSSPIITLEDFVILENLVEAILGTPYERNDLAARTNYTAKGWKKAVKEFHKRVKMDKTELGAKILEEWKQIFRQWQWKEFAQFLVIEGMVVSQADFMAQAKKLEETQSMVAMRQTELLTLRSKRIEREREIQSTDFIIYLLLLERIEKCLLPRLGLSDFADAAALLFYPQGQFCTSICSNGVVL
ncbi:hypothetical protein BDZ91DRAFT_763293 [Kalaharituber pfeilii]|nr:hypothetical protein BDZ91DRAFT_763293 [Kalaharituber pfeilii]